MAVITIPYMTNDEIRAELTELQQKQEYITLRLRALTEIIKQRQQEIESGR